MNIFPKFIAVLVLLALGACASVNTPMKRLVTAETVYTQVVIAATTLGRQGKLSDRAILKFEDARKVAAAAIDAAQRYVLDGRKGTGALIEQAFAAALNFQRVFAEIRGGPVMPSSFNDPPEGAVAGTAILIICTRETVRC